MGIRTQQRFEKSMKELKERIERLEKSVEEFTKKAWERKPNEDTENRVKDKIEEEVKKIDGEI